MAQQLNPKATVRHRRLAVELRKLREERGLTNAQAAGRLGWAPSNLSKAETAGRQPSDEDVRALLDLYGCDEALRLKLIWLAENIGKRGWWTDYRDVLDPSFLELEDDAIEIRSYQASVIPGLLQTDEYAVSVIKLFNTGESSEKQMRRAAARATRRNRLTARDAPVFHTVIEEAVLRRPVGGADDFAEQLTALLVAAELPNVQIQVMPSSSWRHPGYDGSFMIMGFGEVNMDVIYTEVRGNHTYLEDAAQLGLGRVNFASISDAALDETASKVFIEEVRKELLAQ
jgi:transcriptional regulator with XRE-family HTH domain